MVIMSDPQMMPPMPPDPSPPKKGLHPLAWVGVGCGGLLVVGILAVALLIGWGKRKIAEVQETIASAAHGTAAEMLVEMHPDLEIVSEDTETGELTVRVVSTGEELTFDPEELAEGRVTITGSDGTEMALGLGDLDKVPAWVPRYPGAVNEKALFQREAAGEIKGLLVFESSDSPAAIEAFYDGELGTFSSQGSSSINLGSVEQKTLSYGDAGKDLEVTIVLPGGGQLSEVTVSYTSPASP